MPIVKIRDNQTGKLIRVNFENQPSQEDLAEVMDNLNRSSAIQIPQQEAPKSNALVEFGKGLVKPIVDVGKFGLGTLQTAPSGIKALITRKPEDLQAFSRAVESSAYTPEQRQALAGTPQEAAGYGLRAGASLVPYAIPGGTSLKGAMTAGAASGALSSFGEGEDLGGIVRGAATGAVTAGALKGASKAVSPFVRKTASKFGEGLEKSGELYATAGMGSPKKVGEARGLLKGAKTDIISLFDEMNIWDRDPQTALNAVDNMDNFYIDKIVSSKNKTAVSKVVKDFNKQIASRADDAKLSANVRAEMENLIQRKKEFLTSVAGKKTLSASDLQKLKVAVGRDVPKGAYAQDIVEGLKPGSVSSAKRTQDIFRNRLNKAAGTRSAGIKAAALRKIADVTESASNRASVRQPINFTKMGLSTPGAVIAGLPGAVAGYVAERAANSPTGIRAVSKGLYGAGKAVQKAAKSKAPKVLKNVARGAVISGATRAANSPFKKKKEDNYKIARF